MTIKHASAALTLLLTALLASQSFGASECPKYDPDSAKLPTGTCDQPSTTIKYDPDCARLDGCGDKTPQTTTGFTTEPTTGGTKGLLLPAVQAAREAASCGSGRSISAALDQCGKAGYKFAHCTSSSGVWSCEPSDSLNKPGTQATGFTGR